MLVGPIPTETWPGLTGASLGPLPGFGSLSFCSPGTPLQWQHGVERQPDS